MRKGKQMKFKIVVSYQSNGTLFYPTTETIYIIYTYTSFSSSWWFIMLTYIGNKVHYYGGLFIERIYISNAKISKYFLSKTIFIGSCVSLIWFGLVR